MTDRYRLSCQDCAFERSVDGVHRAFDVAERHGDDREQSHPVDFYLIEDEERADESEQGADGADCGDDDTGTE